MDTVPTLSDNSTVLLIMIAVAMFIFFPTAYFGGKKSLIIAVCILTGLTAFVYLYALGLGRSFANSNASGAIDSSQLIMFVLFTCFYLLMAYGNYSLVQTIKGESGYGIQLVVWLVLCVSYPVFDYASQSYQYSQHLAEQKKYYEAEIVIAHPVKFPVLIDHIRFLNVESGSSSVMDNPFSRDDEEEYVYDFEKLRGESEEHLKGHVYYAIDDPRHDYSKGPFSKGALKVPVDFDAFELSWYSIADKKFYKDVFPLTQNKLEISEIHGTHVKKINNLLINILPTGQVDLLKRKGRDILHTVPYWDIAYTDVGSDDLSDILTHFTSKEIDGKRLEELTETYQKALNDTAENNPDEVLRYRSVQPYGIEVKFDESQNTLYKMQKMTLVDFYLGQYRRSINAFQPIRELPLPSHLMIDITDQAKKWSEIHITFNKASLFEQFKTFSAENEGDIYFELILNKDDLTKTSISLNANGVSRKLTDFKVSSPY
ncbi:hypothetical protein [Psychromonas algicola]|uniref:hypothetical protein n=1 Tax=Psychromonas algicola TaxID=2555642 RepID=UPI0010685A73|nr:hypothetical protein [Psychromonas sp. RZ5]TEW52559.1 hypothetical protein E2R67_02710 [Psychromonas sp. RZ5]